MSVGYECRSAPEKGIGVFATREYETEEIVLIGGALIGLSANSEHAVQVGPCRFAYEEGAGTFVNHSCDPNCVPCSTAEGTVNLMARRLIRVGDEITVDYAMRNYVIEFFPDRCKCETVLCRGKVTGWRDLPPELKKAHATSVVPYLVDCTDAI